MMDLLHDNNLYQSPGMFRNIIHMCHSRKDIYGLLEVIYAAQIEDERQMREDSQFDEYGVLLPHDTNTNKRGRVVGGGEYIEKDETFINPYIHLYRDVRTGSVSTNSDNSSSSIKDSNSDRSISESSELMPEFKPDFRRTVTARQNNLELDEEIDNISLDKRRKPINMKDSAFHRSIKPKDWNTIYNAAWHCRNSTMPKNSYTAGYVEVRYITVHTSLTSARTSASLHALYCDPSTIK